MNLSRALLVAVPAAPTTSSRNLALTLAIASVLATACSEGTVDGSASTSAAEIGAIAPAAPMTDLLFLSGEWRGEGSIQAGPGPAHRFAETEHVEVKLGGVLLTLEGMGTSLDDRERATVIHHAYGVLFHEPHGYRMRSFTADGRTIESAVQVSERTLAWSFQLGPRTTRYTIRVTPGGAWTESGEMSEDGRTWRPFFEMTLQRFAP